MSAECIVDNIDIFAENFEGVNLQGKKITKAEFEDCTFVSCDFSETFFSSCKFIECRAKEVDFRNATLQKADCKGALFGNTHLEGANFTDTSDTMIDIRSNHLKGAIFNRYEALFLLESMGIVLVD